VSKQNTSAEEPALVHTDRIRLSPCFRQSHIPRSGYGVRFPQTSTIRLPVIRASFMKLVLKIAAGVFLGIFAVFCVYIGIDSWESHERRRAYMEQQRLEAEALKTRMEHAAVNIAVLTPDKLRALCGVPLREGHYQGIFFSMLYAGTDGNQVSLEFSCDEGRYCFFQGMQQVRSDSFNSSDPADYADYDTYLMTSRVDQHKELHNDHVAQIRELPCLADAK
jgi:hypothetical protein